MEQTKGQLELVTTEANVKTTWQEIFPVPTTAKPNMAITRLEITPEDAFFRVDFGSIPPGATEIEIFMPDRPFDKYSRQKSGILPSFPFGHRRIIRVASTQASATLKLAWEIHE